MEEFYGISINTQSFDKAGKHQKSRLFKNKINHNMKDLESSLTDWRLPSHHVHVIEHDEYMTHQDLSIVIGSPYYTGNIKSRDTCHFFKEVKHVVRHIQITEHHTEEGSIIHKITSKKDKPICILISVTKIVDYDIMFLKNLNNDIKETDRCILCTYFKKNITIDHKRLQLLSRNKHNW